MRVFTAVAERSGFSAAAEALDRSTASVTRQVAALEQRLGTRLLNRTTRRVSLTSAGTAYYSAACSCSPTWTTWKPPLAHRRWSRPECCGSMRR